MRPVICLLYLIALTGNIHAWQDDANAVQQLIKDLKSNEAVKKRKAIKQLASLGSDASSATPLVISLLEKDRDPLIRRGAAEALGSLGGDRKSSIKALAKCNKDADAEVIATASMSLSKFGKDAVPALREWLGDKDTEPKKHAAEAIARIGPDAKEAVPDLIKGFQAETPRPGRGVNLKALYATALGSIGSAAKDAIPVFEAFLEQRVPDQQLRRVTMEALRKIKQ